MQNGRIARLSFFFLYFALFFHSFCYCFTSCAKFDDLTFLHLAFLPPSSSFSCLCSHFSIVFPSFFMHSFFLSWPTLSPFSLLFFSPFLPFSITFPFSFLFLPFSYFPLFCQHFTREGSWMGGAPITRPTPTAPLQLWWQFKENVIVIFLWSTFSGEELLI